MKTEHHEMSVDHSMHESYQVDGNHLNNGQVVHFLTLLTISVMMKPSRKNILSQLSGLKKGKDRALEVMSSISKIHTNK